MDIRETVGPKLIFVYVKSYSSDRHLFTLRPDARYAILIHEVSRSHTTRQHRQ